MTSVFIKDTQKTDTEEKTDRGAEGNVKVEADWENAVRRMPTITRSWKKARNGISPRASGRILALLTP